MKECKKRRYRRPLLLLLLLSLSSAETLLFSHCLPCKDKKSRWKKKRTTTEMVFVSAHVEVSENIVNPETIEDDGEKRRSRRRQRVVVCFGPLVSKCQGQIYTFASAGTYNRPGILMDSRKNNCLLINQNHYIGYSWLNGAVNSVRFSFVLGCQSKHIPYLHW